jgi:putative glutathione S-transferase
MAATPPSGNTWTKEINDEGAFVRSPTDFHASVSQDPGARHPAQANRYHLYVSYACPWAHRTLITRALKGLESVISVDVVHPHLTETGWSFDTDFPGATGDRINHHSHLKQVYQQASDNFAGIVTVPVLWDQMLGTIVNNESAEIIRMFNSEFQMLCAHPEFDLYPAKLRSLIDEVNAWVYPDINNGVYRCGFARSQKAFDAAYSQLFSALDRVEEILSRQAYLCGNTLTEADVRLFATLIRFDSVYHTHFKCNRKLIAQYPAMQGYLAGIYQLPGVAATVNLPHIRHHYYHSHRHLNPSGIVPAGPDVLTPFTSC